MGQLDTNAYYALGAPMYGLLVAVEYWVASRRGVRVFGFADSIGNISAGVGEVIVGLFLGPLLIALYDFGYDHIALVHWPERSWVPWVLAFLVSDFCYYWYHRAGHRVAVLWSIHGVHHQSREFNVTVAMRHPWLSDSYSALFYVPCPLLGIPPTHFFVAISLISFYALTIHTRFFNRPSLYVFTTPATHVLHHATNPRYLGKNLGAMFTIWDRLFGTYAAPDATEPPVLGSLGGYQSHDGAWAQWQFPRLLFHGARRARTFGEVLRVFFSHPGWLPRECTPPKLPAARDDAQIPRSLKTYIATQFGVLLAFAIWVSWLRAHHGWALLLASSLLILFGLGALGGLLDGRRGARQVELIRLLANSSFAFTLAVVGRDPFSLVYVGFALLSARWFVSIREDAPAAHHHFESRG